MSDSKKAIARELGLFAEQQACDIYVRKGYTVLERNWRLGKTEIDIILQKDNTIILSEVKARSGRDMDALSAVTIDKRKRMVRAADSYIRRLKGDFKYRFDIVTLTGDVNNFEIEFFEDAFIVTDLL